MSLPIYSVRSALSLTHQVLIELFSTVAAREILQTAFGESFNFDAALDWLTTEAASSFSNFPNLEIRSATEINYADGAYAAETNTIYLAAEFIAQNEADPDAISRVILEEYGHFLDSRFNDFDTVGDEGQIFAHYAGENFLTAAELVAARSQDDRASVILDNRSIEIEQANPGDNSAFDLIGLTQLRNDPQFVGIDGSGVSIAVIDTGIDTSHPLIAPNYIGGYDFIDDDYDISDPDGHGTHISGIIGAADKTIGVAPDVNLIGLRVMDKSGSGSMGKIETALRWVLSNHQRYNITAVNLSLGIGSFSSESEARVYGSFIADELQRLEDNGVTVVSSIGNNYFANTDTSLTDISFPAIFSTLAVGAVWQDGSQSNTSWHGGSIDYSTGTDRLVSFSQRSDAANVIFAPGTSIASTLSGGGIGRDSGTSQASPHISGAVALLQEASLQFGDRLLTPAEVADILRTTGDRIFDGDDEDDNVSNTNLSYSRVNVYSAVREVKRRYDKLNLSVNNSTESTIDVNGTIAGAYIVPDLSFPLDPFRETIGRDGDKPNGMASLLIYDNDVDFYSFRVTSLGTVSIEVTANNNFDSYLRLFDAAGNELAANNNFDSSTLLSRLDLNLELGTYYLGVSGYNNTNYDPNLVSSGIAGSTGDYELNFSFEPETSTIHRFFRSDIGVHFYTASEAERDAIDANLSHYIYEGESFASALESNDSFTGAKPVYRFFNTSTGAHLYTMSEAERDHIDSKLTNYSFEGVAYYGYESDRPDAIPLYRFYNAQIDAHFYTPSSVEKDAILANLPDYQLEGSDGIAFYVEPLT